MLFNKVIQFFRRIFQPAKIKLIAPFQTEKELRAREEMEKLYAEHRNLDAGTILVTLVKIHRDYGELPFYPYHPIFYPVNSEKSLMLYDIMRFVAHNPTLSVEHVAWLVQMLNWKEIKNCKDSSVRFRILQAISKFSNRTFIMDLELHLCYLKMERTREAVGTHYYVGLCEEITELKKLIALCEKDAEGR
ncbi:MAG: hypothetical protein COU51_05120 [Parcubacteria group bacterium CG10_big_fil_rev_8_21_14_0_10_36_14]|nr:MAG: hypothetical protein COU51_05120 [Parcubacteria group bacterium CG10_big_fil_rev_8_21_14_0_10_36_14]